VDGVIQYNVMQRLALILLNHSTKLRRVVELCRW